MILSRDILQWQSISVDPNALGVSTKELRFDPGSGARTELRKIEAGATRPWMKSSVLEEGYLLEGSHEQSECVQGKILTAEYTPGGYYHRPAGAVNGSLASDKSGAAVWLVRTLSHARITAVDECAGAEK